LKGGSRVDRFRSCGWVLARKSLIRLRGKERDLKSRTRNFGKEERKKIRGKKRRSQTDAYY